MATSISSTGIGSGLDVNSIISSTMNVEKLPLQNLQAAATTMQSKLSAYGQIQSMVSSFRDAAAPLYDPITFNATNATSTDEASVSAVAGTGALPGSYTISVSALSSTQSTVSANGQFSASTDTVGTGSLTLRLGTWNADQTSFTPKTGSSDIVIPIGASESTLAGIRDKINASGSGINATIITDTTGSRLALQSASSGAENGFRITTSDDDGTSADGTGLSRLAFDPQNGAGQMTLTQSAANATAKINGITISSATNTMTNAIDGVTFNLNKITTTPVSVGIARNSDAVKTTLTSFVTAYNALNSLLAAATKYDPTAKAGALLQGDATTTGILNQLRSAISQPSGASSTYGTLSSLGLEFQKDGSLKLNDTKVAAALKNFPEMSKALSNVDLSNPSKNGFAKKLTVWADSLLASNGTLPGKQQSIQSQIASNQKDQDKFSDRLTQIEARLKAQYTALDATMSKANALQSFVTQQIATWNKSTA